MCRGGSVLFSFVFYRFVDGLVGDVPWKVRIGRRKRRFGDMDCHLLSSSESESVCAVVIQCKMGV